MLNIGNKTFMNLQEAVGWLLENNALPFQSTANYVANTEIAMSTLVNPSPAKVRVGSLIFFADSKVSTVVGVTSNSFIVSDQYNDLVDDVVYVSNVALNASGHLIVTLSNGDTIDAGLIKQVSNFSINGSYHLIVNYNDGTSTDLGAIFSGNITISGNLTVTGDISGDDITGNSIVEIMAGYTFDKSDADVTWTPIYVNVVKNGNKLTFVVFGSYTHATVVGYNKDLGKFNLPQAIADKLYPFTIAGDAQILDIKSVLFQDSTNVANDVMLKMAFRKYGSTRVYIRTYNLNSLTEGTTYLFRFEGTFLLSNSLI